VKGRYEGGGGGEMTELTSSLQIWDRLEVGPYQVTTLRAMTEDTLINWLNANGYQFPEAASITIQYYVQKQWYFVALKVATRNSGASTQPLSLKALRMSFKTQKPVFPLKISEISAAANSEVLIYVLSKNRATCDYAVQEVNTDELYRQVTADIENRNASGVACSCKNPSSPGEYVFDYESFFQKQLNSESEPTFLIEYADWFYPPVAWAIELNPDTSYFLTRFRSYLRPDQMADVTFSRDAAGDNTFRVSYTIHYAKATTHPFRLYAGCFLGLLALPLNLYSGLRQRFARKFWLLVLLSFMLI